METAVDRMIEEAVANGETLLGMSGDDEGSFYSLYLITPSLSVYTRFHFVMSMFTSVIPIGLLHPNDPSLAMQPTPSSYEYKDP